MESNNFTVCPHSGVSHCTDCGLDVKTPKVQESAAGFYVGTFCNCGPYARWSVEYFGSHANAEKALNEGSYTLRPNPAW